MSEDEDDAKQPEDVLLLHSPTEDGAGVRVVRSKKNKLEIGEVRPLRDGQPITGEVVSLEPRTYDDEGAPRVCEVKVLYDARGRSGPPQVATQEYRQHWDAVFGPKPSASNTRPN